MNIYLDIETIPSQRDDVYQMIVDTITPPGTLTKPESIAKWEAEKKPDAIEQEWRKTALSGTYGEIICMAWAIDDDDVNAVSRTLVDSEADMLRRFFDQLAPLVKMPGRPVVPTWIGHYISEFDLRFIWQRCVVNRVRPTIRLPYDAKPWSDQIFDTKIEWGGLRSNGYNSLHHVNVAMGYTGKTDLDGSKVWDYIKAGRYSEVTQYCMDDVEDARHIHQRMIFKGESA